MPSIVIPTSPSPGPRLVIQASSFAVTVKVTDAVEDEATRAAPPQWADPCTVVHGPVYVTPEPAVSWWPQTRTALPVTVAPARPSPSYANTRNCSAEAVDSGTGTVRAVLPFRPPTIRHGPAPDRSPSLNSAACRPAKLTVTSPLPDGTVPRAARCGTGALADGVDCRRSMAASRQPGAVKAPRTLPSAARTTLGSESSA